MGSTRKLSAFGVMGRSFLILLRNLPVFVFLALLLFTPVFVGSLIVGPGAPIHAQRVDVDDVDGVRHTELGGKVVIGHPGLPRRPTSWRGASRTACARTCRVGACRSSRASARACDACGWRPGHGVRHGPPRRSRLRAARRARAAGSRASSFVAVPAALLEERGVVESLRRSGDLTRGHRLPILVVFLRHPGADGAGRLVRARAAVAPRADARPSWSPRTSRSSSPCSAASPRTSSTTTWVQRPPPDRRLPLVGV